jgi:P2-related tail formation protein
MHLHKGTVGGVEDALEALGIRAEIVEWWQAEPVAEVGTMQVTLWVNDNILPHADMLISDELTRDVIAQLDRSKRASIHYTFQLAVDVDVSTLALGMSGQMTTLQRVEAAHTAISAESPPMLTGFGMSGQMTALQRVEAAHTAISAESPPMLMGFGMSGQMTTLQRVEVTL